MSPLRHDHLSYRPPTRRRRPLRLERLECRAVPAAATWAGGGADNHWTTAANWAGGAAPQPGDDLVFPANPVIQTTVNDFPAGTAFGSISFTGINYDLYGNRITLARGVTASAQTGGDRVLLDVTLAAPQTFASAGAGTHYTVAGTLDLNGNALTLTGAGGAAISGPVTGAGGLIKDGAGAVALSGANTYTGPTEIRAGVVEIDSAAALGASGAGNDTTVASGGAVALSGTFTAAEAITFSGGMTSLPYDPTQALAVSPVRVLAGNPTLSGSLSVPSTASLATASGTSLTITGAVGGSGGLILFGTVHFTASATTALANSLQVQTGTTRFDGRFLSGSVSGPFSPPGAPINDGILTGTGTLGSVNYYGGEIDPGAGGPGVLAVNGYLDIGARALTPKSCVLHIDLANVLGQVAADRLDVQGDVLLRIPVLALAPAPGFVPPAGVRVPIITYTGAGPAGGTFAGLPEGAVVQTFGDTALHITYRGEGGHAVELYATPAPALAVGAGAGGGPQVNAYGGSGGRLYGFNAYDPAFRGGVRVATADLTGDGVKDVITAPGPGGGPDVRVFDGATGALVREWMAYDPNFTGGVFVAAGDVNGDGVPDVVTGAGPGGGSHVKVFSGKDGSLLGEFMAYVSAFRGGVMVAAGDLNGDGKADIITGAGPGGGPHVEVFDGAALPAGVDRTLFSFLAYAPGFTGGVSVAAGDVTGDGVPDVVTAPGAGGGPDVRVFDGTTGSLAREFLAYAPGFTGGVCVAAVNPAGGPAGIVTGAGPGGGPHVAVFGGPSLAPGPGFLAFDPAFTGGVFVG